MKYKAILSDLDKTLIEDSFVFPKVRQVVQEQLHIPLEKADQIVRDFYDTQTTHAHYLNGFTKVGAWKKVLTSHHIMYDLETIPHLNAIFWATAATFARVFPGVLEAIQKIKKNGMYFAVVSGGDYITRLLHVKKTGLLPYTDALITTEEIGDVKHERNLYALAARELFIGPHEAIAIGDNEIADVMLPKKEGFTAIKIGKTSKHADYVIPSFSKLPDLLETIQQ